MILGNLYAYNEVRNEQNVILTHVLESLKAVACSVSKSSKVTFALLGERSPIH